MGINKDLMFEWMELEEELEEAETDEEIAAVHKKMDELSELQRKFNEGLRRIADSAL